MGSQLASTSNGVARDSCMAWSGTHVSSVCRSGWSVLSLQRRSLSAGSDGKPQRTYLRDAYCYRPKTGWTRLPTSSSSSRCGQSCPVYRTIEFLGSGGDDGSLVNFRPLDQHPGFPKSILAYSAVTDTWTSPSDQLPSSHVTTSVYPGRANL